MALCEGLGGGSALVWPRVLLFGDSITQFSFQQGGWGAALADKLVRKCDVLNRGFSGYNTRWAKIILPRLIRKGNILDNPVAVTIFFGANDSALKDENPKQHIPLEEYAANLRSMVQYLKSLDIPESRLVLITPPPLCEAAWEKECLAQGCKLNRLNSVVGEYANACLHVAQDCGTDVLDLWALMQKDGQVEWLAWSFWGLFMLLVRWTALVTKGKRAPVLPPLAFDREESLFPAAPAPLLARCGRSKTRAQSSRRWGPLGSENEAVSLQNETSPMHHNPKTTDQRVFSQA